VAEFLEALKHGGLSGQGLFCLFGNSSECCWIMESQLRKSTAIDVDAGLLHAVNETAVAQIIHAGSSVETLNPQTAEGTLFIATIAVCEVASAQQSLFDCAQQTTTTLMKALGAAHQATAAAEAWDYISCARHRLGPHHFAKVFSDTTDCNSRLTQFAPTLSGFASHHMPRHHVTANDLAFFGEFHAA
jgi:hypothetical protein